MKCNLCQSTQLKRLGYVGHKPVSITSDSKLCGLQAIVYYCSSCQHLQKHHTLDVLNIIQKIYQHYDPHYLSFGNEQLVFPENLSPRPRTYHALEQCLPYLPIKGKLLDIGTGNGAVLKSAGKLLPQWDLYALDVSDKHQETILRLPNVVGFAAMSIENLPGEKFDLIVLWHTLEHIPEPVETMRQLRSRLSDAGSVLIQVPDVARTPFDLAVIDHCSHFTPRTLMQLCHSAGFDVRLDGYDWIHNCLTLLLSSGGGSKVGPDRFEPDVSPMRYFEWLNRTLTLFEDYTKDRDYVLFGTGMASIWLLGQLSRRPLCIMDEDSRKAGNHIEGIPIHMPDETPGGIHVVMPFTYANGKKIRDKLQNRYQAQKRWHFLLTEPLNQRH